MRGFIEGIALSMKVGILSLQGDFEAHAETLRGLGAESVEVRHAAQLPSIDGLILPGGESTTVLKLLDREGMTEPLVEFASRSPVLGTCAGAILMATEVSSPAQRSLGLIDMAIKRNAYGRQLDSSIRRVEPSEEFGERTEVGPMEAVFIRAPKIRRVGNAVTVLATDGEDPILVEQGNCVAATFHPELSDERRVHALFLDKVRSSS